MLKNIKITIEYDGTHFNGWQRQTQPKQRTVQGVLEEAMRLLLGEEITLHASGRTDSGVHSFGQTATFSSSMRVPTEKFARVINTRLPFDIVILEAIEVEPDFHARFSAIGKRYTYQVFNNPMRSTMRHDHYFQVYKKLNINSMKAATELLIGRKDFRSFMASGSSVTNTVREIYDIDFHIEGDVIRLEFVGSGFLYNMVRIMVGLIVDVGLDYKSVNEIPDIIELRDRCRVSHTAPAKGLYLTEVYYDKIPEQYLRKES